MRTTCLSLTFATLAAASSVSARDLYWWGYAGTAWDMGQATNFRESSEATTGVAFESGANAIFDDAHIAPNSVRTSLSGALTIGDLLFDLSRDFSVTSTAARTMTATSFVKRGAGTLRWVPVGTTFTIGDNRVAIEEGRLELEPATQSATIGSCGSATAEGTTFDIAKGAEFCVRFRSALSGNSVTGEYGVKVNVHTGGVFSLRTGYASSSLQNYVNTLNLDGGSLVLDANGYNGFGVLGIVDRLALSGPTPYVFAQTGNRSNNYMAFGKGEVEIAVADITGDAAADATFAAGYPMVKYSGWTADATSVRKTGAGTLAFRSPVLDAGNYPALTTAVDGDFTIEGGTLSLMTNSCVYGGFARTMTVEDGATLHIGWHNPFHTNVTDKGGGAVDATPAHVATAIDVKKGGTLKVQRPRSVFEDGSVAFGPLSFEDATFDFRGFYTGASALGVVQFTDKVWFKKGTNRKPYVFLQTNKTDVAGSAAITSTQIKRSAILLNGNPEICVEDITGDGGEDVVLAHNLCDTKGQNSGFVKTGAGTLRFGSNSGKTYGDEALNANNGFNSSYRGDVVVREGTLQIGPEIAATYSGTFLGEMTTNMAHRTISIEKDGTLYLPNRNVFVGSIGATNAPFNCTFVVRGTYRQAAGQLNVLPNLTVDGGDMDIRGTGIGGYGVQMVAGTFRVTGSKPCRILLPDGIANDNRSFFAVNGCPETTFDIENVSGDGAPDLDFTRLVSKNQKAVGQVGFTKRGDGTLRLGGDRFNDTFVVDGDVKVEAGTLLADGSNLARVRDIAVSAGAALGGTGTVARATLAVGAKLTVRTSSVRALTVTGDLAIGGTGTVDVVDDAQIGWENVKRLPIVSNANLAAVDFSNWNVTFNGVPQGDYRLHNLNGTLTVSQSGGLMLLIR